MEVAPAVCSGARNASKHTLTPGNAKSHLKLKTDEQKSLDTDIDSSAPETLGKMHVHRQDEFSSHSAEKKRGAASPVDGPARLLQPCAEPPSSGRKLGLIFSRLIRLTKPSINKSIIGKHASTFNFGFLEGTVSPAATLKSVGQGLHCFTCLSLSVSSF